MAALHVQKTGLVIYRQLRGDWRKTFWPLLVWVAPSETKDIYQKMAAKLKELMGPRLNIGSVAQVGMDWFGGIADALQAEWPSAHPAGSLWHLIRNNVK